jgi:hypothetical protein
VVLAEAAESLEWRMSASTPVDRQQRSAVTLPTPRAAVAAARHADPITLGHPFVPAQTALESH